MEIIIIHQHKISKSCKGKVKLSFHFGFIAPFITVHSDLKRQNLYECWLCRENVKIRRVGEEEDQQCNEHERGKNTKKIKEKKREN